MENDQKYPFEAIVIDEDVNKNGWKIKEGEIDNIISQIKAEVQLRINHSQDKSEEVIGLLNDAVRVPNPKGGGSAVKAKGFIDDKPFALKAHHRTLRDISIRGDATEIRCSKCDEDMSGVKACKKCGNKIREVSGFNTKEFSLVTDGAFEGAEILPNSFSAALEIIDSRAKQIIESNQLEAKCMPDDMKKKDEEIAKLKAEIEDLKKDKEEKAKAEEEEDKKKEEEAALKAQTEKEKVEKEKEEKAAKELDELRKERDELKAQVAAEPHQSGGGSQGNPDPEPFKSTVEGCYNELFAAREQHGLSTPREFKGA